VLRKWANSINSNSYIGKYRTWLHKHGGKGCAGEKGKHDSFTFACVFQNTFFAHRDINEVAELDFK
jgi:hypothetical protein